MAKLVKPPTKLTKLQFVFIDKLFELKLDAINAYFAAFPRCKKNATARQNSWKLMNENPLVMAEIARRKKELHEASKETVDKIREELEYMGFARISNYLSFGPGGVTLKTSDAMTPEMLAAVAEVSETINAGGGSTVKFKLSPKEKALELLMRYYGLIVEKMEHTGKDGNPIEGKLVNMADIMTDIAKAQKQGTLWNEGEKLEDGDL